MGPAGINKETGETMETAMNTKYYNRKSVVPPNLPEDGMHTLLTDKEGMTQVDARKEELRRHTPASFNLQKTE